MRFPGSDPLEDDFYGSRRGFRCIDVLGVPLIALFWPFVQ
jgi:hypothetical protein